MLQTDFLIIGSGIAGLTFAIKVANHLPNTSITIITKADESESNSKYAQGGIAVALDNKDDSFIKHIEDTLKAGDGLCNKDIVDLVVKEGPERLKELSEWGVAFDMHTTGSYQLGREGGHSVNRIVHHKDATGLEMELTLLTKIHQTPNITLLTHHFAIDLITEHHISEVSTTLGSNITCYGAYILNEKNHHIEKIISRITVLATGGVGQAYKNTTNPLIATGDGVAMAYRAKALIKDMEFIQFHPTALYHPGESPSYLISEAVRGFGAKLKTKNGQAFMHKYDEREELSSRDIIARAIDNEMKISGDEYVLLDCSHLDIQQFKEHFPNIYKKCISIGINIEREGIPVVPAAHYLCGGIQVDNNGQTTINHLYACGECTFTGLHGANRLASNSLLEALVFAHRSYQDAVSKVENIPTAKNVPDWNASGTVKPREMIIITHNRIELQSIMSDFVGIVRTDERLQRALKRLEIIYNETKYLYDNTVLSPQLCELRNLVTVAYLIIHQSLERDENKGVFYKLKS